MKLSLFFYAALLAAFAVAAPPVAAQAPPPTPTLAPVEGPATSATQTLQLQEFARESAYRISSTTSYTATVLGETWAVDRTFTYGDRIIAIGLGALFLLQAFQVAYTVVITTRRQG
jgi:hypothetical protein